jgi:uncharacterized protein (TIGR00645 family)
MWSENFVSRLDLEAHPDRPTWMGRVGFRELKLKLMTSIVAISAIHVLEDFMNATQLGADVQCGSHSRQEMGSRRTQEDRCPPALSI